MTNPLIECCNVNFSVPGRENKILNDISFKINKEEFVLFLGGNGSGKSSLLKLLNRQQKRFEGIARFDDANILGVSQKQYSEEIFKLTQSVADSLFLELTVFENAILMEARTKKSKSKKHFFLEIEDYLNGFNETLAKSLNTPVENLSGGEQQILMLALTMRHKPRLLLLDEHTSALDPKTAEKVMQFTQQHIQRKKVTCIMTTHNLEFAMNYGDRVFAMRDGKLAYQSDKKEHLTKEQLLAACY
jgi:putative tryptophan/tyrosine transport system ATP-binding protein